MLITAGLLCGCVGNGRGKDQVQGITSLASSPELSYTVPSAGPNILANQFGYRREGRKVAVLVGENLSGEFRVIDNDTGKVVYTGEMEQAGYSRACGQNISTGDFTRLSEAGEYYVECDSIGRSYPFVISDDIYMTIMSESLTAMKQFREEAPATEEACKAVSTMLLAYELFPDVGMGTAQGEIPAVVEEVSGWITELAKEQNAETGDLGRATAWFSAVMAKFSYTYQKFDNEYANQCLKAADLAWRYVEKNPESFSEEERFFAASELYRATGQYQYHKIVKELGEKLTPDPYKDALFYGSITYSATKRSVDVKLCEKFLENLMDEAESIAKEYKAADSLMEGKRTIEKVLWQMLLVSVVDYVITNHEYATVIENHQQYLAGRNKDAICYIGEENCDNAALICILNSPIHTAQYMVMLSEMMSHANRETHSE